MPEKISGTVKWFSNRKGYGFISYEEGPDLFVHFRSILGEGFRGLQEGQEVTFIASDGPKGPQAEEVEATS